MCAVAKNMSCTAFERQNAVLMCGGYCRLNREIWQNLPFAKNAYLGNF